MSITSSTAPCLRSSTRLDNVHHTSKGGGLVGSTAVVVPTSPTLTRLSYGDRGQIVEVAALLLGPRPTRGPRVRGGFLGPDLSNLWVQTSSGSCTKRLGGVVPDSTIAEGRDRR